MCLIVDMDFITMCDYYLISRIYDIVLKKRMNIINKDVLPVANECLKF